MAYAQTIIGTDAGDFASLLGTDASDLCAFLGVDVWSPPQHSCAFNRASGTYLSRAVTTTGNNKRFTISAWMYMTDPDNYHYQMISAGTGHGIQINSNGYIGVFTHVGNSNFNYDFSPNTWYHICVNVDTANATPSNRIKIYVNGVSLTLTGGSYPAQNFEFRFNASGYTHYIGGYSSDGLDGLLYDFHLCDAYIYDYSHFYDNGRPVRFDGYYSTNGFRLDFEDSGDLGNDASPYGNDYATANSPAQSTTIPA